MKTRLIALAVGLALAGAAHAAQPIEGTRAARPDVRVEVENVRGAINVTGWDKPQVDVAGSLGEGSKLAFTGSEEHVVIRVEHENEDWSWWGNRGPKEDTLLEIKVPFGAALDLGGVSADVTVSGIVGSREVEAESVSGDVTVTADAERVDVSSVSGDVALDTNSRNVSLETVSGDIEVRRAGGRIHAESVSGRVRIDAAATEDVDAGTVSGDVEIDVANSLTGRVRVESMSGEVTVLVPEGLSARIDAETFSGKIRSAFGHVEDDEGPGSSLSVTVGKGDAEITLESFSGDVELRNR
jgi:DUF4097 and DUF4098 domain-containing protein YvlB